MTRKEAVAVNRVLLALVAQKQLLKTVGLELGMTSFDGGLLDAATLLADHAHISIRAGLDPLSMRRAWRDPHELGQVIADLRHANS